MPVWQTLLEITLNILIAAFATARLHDASYSARWLIALVGLAIASAFPFASALAAIGLLGWIALFFLPPSIGPNRYGSDPRCWKSREQFEQQQRDLAEQANANAASAPEPFSPVPSRIRCFPSGQRTTAYGRWPIQSECLTFGRERPVRIQEASAQSARAWPDRRGMAPDALLSDARDYLFMIP
jgi:hypothetical protein